MIYTAHVLTELGVAKFTPEAYRIADMSAVLQKLGFNVRLYSDNLIDKNMAMNMETQLNVSDGDKTIFADAALGTLTSRAKKGDVIIATCPWHQLVFKGVLQETGGRINDVPVIELWIDYPKSFAHYRVFGSQWTLATAASREDVDDAHNPNWLVSLPYVHDMDIQRGEVHEPLKSHSLNFLYHMAYGHKILAPSFGAWAELVIHGKTGVLYRTLRGKENGRRILEQITEEDVQEWVSINCNLEDATDRLRSYFTQVLNG